MLNRYRCFSNLCNQKNEIIILILYEPLQKQWNQTGVVAQILILSRTMKSKCLRATIEVKVGEKGKFI